MRNGWVSGRLIDDELVSPEFFEQDAFDAILAGFDAVDEGAGEVVHFQDVELPIPEKQLLLCGEQPVADEAKVGSVATRLKVDDDVGGSQVQCLLHVKRFRHSKQHQSYWKGVAGTIDKTGFLWYFSWSHP
jgi:hypothetical protein